MACEGVSGEIATPAFIPFAWILDMRGRGSAAEVCQRESEIGDGLTGGFDVKTIEGATCSGDVIHPLSEGLLKATRGYKARTYLFRLGNHHVAIHEDVRDALVDTGQDWSPHGDVRDKVTIGEEDEHVGPPDQTIDSHPSMTSGDWSQGTDALQRGRADPCVATLRRP
jgi:hypothetical protein